MDNYIDYQQKWNSIINKKGVDYANYDFSKKSLIIYMTYVYLYGNLLDKEEFKEEFSDSDGEKSLNLF